MRQLTAFHYQLIQHKKAIFIYYSVIMCITLSLYLGVIVISSGDSSSSIQGVEVGTAIFLFVVGLNSFKENFGMLLQNGVSRKNLYKSRIAVTFTIAAIMVVIDNVYMLVLKFLSNLSYNFSSGSLYDQIYNNQKTSKISVLQMHSESYLFSFFMYTAFMALGYFITILFYSMGKRGKIAVGAGVPIVLTMVLPSIDSLFFKGSISTVIYKFLDFAFGISSVNPFHAILTFLMLFLVCSTLSWWLLKRVMIKK